jgi:hypothetical protein
MHFRRKPKSKLAEALDAPANASPAALARAESLRTTSVGVAAATLLKSVCEVAVGRAVSLTLQMAGLDDKMRADACAAVSRDAAIGLSEAAHWSRVWVAQLLQIVSLLNKGADGTDAAIATRPDCVEIAAEVKVRVERAAK